MMKEEGENGRDDMLIDDPRQVEDEGFNSNYLKVYYGNFVLLNTLFSLFIISSTDL